MPLRDTSGIGERAARELVDADIAVAFSLAEMAETESSRGNPQVASQLLHKAENMLASVRERLRRMPPAQSQMLEPRCEELAGAIQKMRTNDVPES